MITSKQISFRSFDDVVFILSFLLISGRLLFLNNNFFSHSNSSRCYCGKKWRRLYDVLRDYRSSCCS